MLLLLLEISDILGLVLYLTIGLLIAAQFRQLHLEIEHYFRITFVNWPASINSKSMNKNNLLNFSFRLRKWHATYNKLFDIVHQFQNCFDTLLLFWIVFLFITFINYTFYLVDAVSFSLADIEQVFQLLVYVGKHTINLLVLTAVPMVIQKQVRLSFTSTYIEH